MTLQEFIQAEQARREAQRKANVAKIHSIFYAYDDEVNYDFNDYIGGGVDPYREFGFSENFEMMYKAGK